MALIQLSFSAPNVALVAEIDNGINPSVALVTVDPNEVFSVESTFVVSQNEYSTLSAALTAAQAIDPDVRPEEVYGELDLTEVSVPDNYEVLVGDPAYLKVEYTSSDTAVTYSYQWYKNGEVIYDATTDTLQGIYAAGMAGNYECEVTLAQSSSGRSTTLKSPASALTTKTPPLYAADALGGVDPYGIINTGRGGGAGSGGPDDLNPSFIALIDNTYAVSDLELYVPTTSTVISYDGGLTPPFTFDSSGNCFNGTDYEMEIRVAATSLVLATITVPETDTNESTYWY